MKQAGLLLTGLAMVWVGCWLGLGLLFGQPTLLLHPLEAPEYLRVLYLLMLYGGMVALLVVLWRKSPPGVPWGRPATAAKAWGLAAGGVLLQRLCLGSAWHPQWPDAAALLSAALLAPWLALVEEAVFRGYLYGSLRRGQGRILAALTVSGFFALVHLFRPGTAEFKLCYGLGLVLTSLVLIVVVEKAGLLASAAMHSAWISANVLDPPGRVDPGWWSGLNGEPTAGLCSWVLLILLGWTCWKKL